MHIPTSTAVYGGEYTNLPFISHTNTKHKTTKKSSEAFLSKKQKSFCKAEWGDFNGWVFCTGDAVPSVTALAPVYYGSYEIPRVLHS